MTVLIGGFPLDLSLVNALAFVTLAVLMGMALSWRWQHMRQHYKSGPLLEHTDPQIQPAAGTRGTGRSGNLSLRQHVDNPLLAEVWLHLRHDRATAALELVKAARLAGGAAPVPCYRAIMQHLGCHPIPELFNELVEEMCLAQVPADRAMDAFIVRCFCRGRNADLQVALESHEAVLASGAQPDLATVECLAAAALRNKRFETVRGLVACASDCGLRPTVVLLACLLAACAEMHDKEGLEAALASFRAESLLRGYSGDRMAFQMGYSVAVSMLCLGGNGADALFAEARGELGLLMPSSTIAALFAAACDAGDDRLVLQLAAQGQQDGVVSWPNCPLSKAVQLQLERSPLESAMKQVVDVLQGDIGEIESVPLYPPIT